MTWVAAAIGGSAVLGYMGSQNAANAQLQGTQAGIAAQQQMFNTQNQQQTGYRAAGQNALSQIGALGSGTYQSYDQAGNPVGAPQEGSGYLTHQFNAQDFANGIDPGYAFRLQQGQQQAQRQANVGGGALSGNTLAGLEDYTQGQASQEYGNAFNRYQTQRGNIYNTLASIAGLGQTSLGQTTQAGTQAGTNLASLNVAGGNAAANGIASGTKALTGGLNSAGDYAFYNNLQNPANQTYTDTGGWSGGGSGVVNVPGQGSTTIANYFNGQ